MKLGTFTGCAVALSLIGPAVAHAETIYVGEPYLGEPIAAAPTYVYQAPAPIVAAPGYVAPAYVGTMEPGYAVIAAPRAIVVQRPARTVVERSPGWIARPGVYESPSLYAPAHRRIQVQYIPQGACSVDFSGIERCY